MNEAATPRALIAFLSMAFVGLGLSIASIGPALPEFAAVAGLAVSSGGVLYSALFAGFLLSQITATVILERTGTRVVIPWALAVFAAGTVGLALAVGVKTMLGASAVLGVGYGSCTIAINLVASRLLTHRPAFVVNLINALYGVGTVAGPLIASWTLGSGGRAGWVPAVGGLAALALLPWAWRVLPPDGQGGLRESTPRPRGHSRLPLPLLLIGGLVFLYGGVESGFSGWAPTYLERTLALPPASAALWTSVYWFSYLAGRIISTGLALRIGPAAVLQGALAVLTAGGPCPGGERRSPGRHGGRVDPARRGDRADLPVDVRGGHAAVCRARRVCRLGGLGDRLRRRHVAALGDGPDPAAGGRACAGRHSSGPGTRDVGRLPAQSPQRGKPGPLKHERTCVRGVVAHPPESPARDSASRESIARARRDAGSVRVAASAPRTRAG